MLDFEINTPDSDIYRTVRLNASDNAVINYDADIDSR